MAVCSDLPQEEEEDIKPDSKKLRKGKGKAKASDSDDENEEVDSVDKIPPSTKLIWIGASYGH